MKRGSQSAILLLGATGSGKTPLGQLLERKGLWGRRCFHFDFGENLRDVARNRLQNHGGLTSVELATVVESLETGRLLTDREFSIAAKILKVFSVRKCAGRGDLLVLNGLPRHAGQAKRIDRLLDIIWVVHLVCGERTVLRRIRLNAGGDRKGRNDDTPAQVREKIAIFKKQTAPLLDHYRRKGVRILPVNVGLSTTSEGVLAVLERKGE
jgi:adenylate kinase family enzyme